MPQNKNVTQYMVVFDVPLPVTEEIISLIPDQRAAVNRLFTNGKMILYTLSNDRSKLWAVFLAESESELLTLIDKLPISSYMDFSYHDLMFYQSNHMLPALSLN